MSKNLQWLLNAIAYSNLQAFTFVGMNIYSPLGRAILKLVFDHSNLKNHVICINLRLGVNNGSAQAYTEPLNRFKQFGGLTRFHLELPKPVWTGLARLEPCFGPNRLYQNGSVAISTWHKRKIIVYLHYLFNWNHKH